MSRDPDWIVPAGAPDGVGALMSTRAGGVSAAPWKSLNLGVAVGDDPAAIRENRRRFGAALGARPVYLRQVHGTRVVRLPGELPPDDTIEADACVTALPGVACTIQVADCLPLLLAAPGGRAVGAAHAGWRGLAGGVIEACVGALCETASCAPQGLWAWLGPCIGPSRFEVGSDVRTAFAGEEDLFADAPARQGQPKWHADLAGLARRRLRRLGVDAIGGVDGACTASDASRFFSFRRDGVCGRHAAVIWRRAEH